MYPISHLSTTRRLIKLNHSMKSKIVTAALSATLLLGAFSAPAALAAQSAEVVAGVNMRTSPSTSAAVIRMLKKGEDITIVNKVNDYWYQVKDQSGKTGYISTSSKYVNVSGSSSSSGSGSGSVTSNEGAVGVIQGSVSFRKGASTSSDRIRYMKKGEQVTVLSKPNSYWYQVKDSSGVTGYVSSSSSYIKVTGTIPNSDSSSSSNSGNSGSSSSGSGQQSSSKTIENIIKVGMSYLGTPYEYGSDRNTTTTFDCSDFVKQIFKEGAGVTLPADSRKQGQYVKDNGSVQKDWTKLKRGDLMFFMSYKGSKASAYSGVNKNTATITHDGIYLGDGKILHTYSKESGGVTISSIKGTHWEHRFLFGGSAL